MSTCQNNLEILCTEKIAMHKASGYLMFKSCSFDATKNKLDCYRSKDCLERFCKDLKEHTASIVNYEKKGMISLTDKENKSYEKQKVCCMYKK